MDNLESQSEGNSMNTHPAFKPIQDEIDGACLWPWQPLFVRAFETGYKAGKEKNKQASYGSHQWSWLPSVFTWHSRSLWRSA